MASDGRVEYRVIGRGRGVRLAGRKGNGDGTGSGGEGEIGRKEKKKMLTVHLNPQMNLILRRMGRTGEKVTGQCSLLIGVPVQAERMQSTGAYSTQ